MTDKVVGVAAGDVVVGATTRVEGGHGRRLYVSLIRGTGALAPALWVVVVHEPTLVLKAERGSDRHRRR